jgi:hypothetical protein
VITGFFDSDMRIHILVLMTFHFQNRYIIGHNIYEVKIYTNQTYPVSQVESEPPAAVQVVQY